MLDQHKLTRQYRKTVNAYPKRWYFITPGDPVLDWSHRYVKSSIRDKRGYHMIADITTAHLQFKRFKPRNVYIDIIDGPKNYAIDDTGTILQNGGSMMDIYNSPLEEFNHVAYKVYPELSSYQNSPSNIRQIVFDLCQFVNNDLSVLNTH